MEPLFKGKSTLHNVHTKIISNISKNIWPRIRGSKIAFAHIWRNEHRLLVQKGLNDWFTSSVSAVASCAGGYTSDNFLMISKQIEANLDVACLVDTTREVYAFGKNEESI